MVISTLSDACTESLIRKEVVHNPEVWVCAWRAYIRQRILARPPMGERESPPCHKQDSPMLLTSVYLLNAMNKEPSVARDGTQYPVPTRLTRLRYLRRCPCMRGTRDPHSKRIPHEGSYSHPVAVQLAAVRGSPSLACTSRSLSGPERLRLRTTTSWYCLPSSS